MNPRTQTLLALLALSLLWVPLVFASTGEVTIAYSGLTRTREATVERIAQIQPGMSAEELDVEAVRDRLLRSGLFADVDVSLDTESTVLTIAVEERWTLIPVPFFSVDSQSVRGGFALLESNLVGSGYAGLFAGFFGSDGYQVMSGFIASSVGVRGPGFAVFAALGQSAVETSDTANELVERFDLQRYSLAARVTLRPNERLSPVLGASLKREAASPGDAPIGTTPDSVTVIEPAAGLEWENLRYVSFFNRGTTARAVYRHGFSVDGGAVSVAASLDAAWTIAIADRHRLQFDYRGLASDADGLQVERPAGPGFRVLPSGRVTAARYSAAGVTAEVPVLVRRWGTVTLSGFYDGGVLAGGASGDTGYHGPGGSVALYLARIALPAVGVTVGYNVDSGFLAASALVGFSM